MEEDPSKKGEDSSSTNEAVEENDAIRDKTGRRIQDGITSKTPTRKMNLDRRYDSERRSKNDSDPGYDGPPRRYTIDRRGATKDRRKPD